jgi:hypothetical protein
MSTRPPDPHADLARDALPPPPGPELIGGDHTLASVTEKIASITLTRRTPLGWFVGFGIAFTLFMGLLWAVVNLLFVGIGVWDPTCPWGGASTSSTSSGGSASATRAR